MASKALVRRWTVPAVVLVLGLCACGSRADRAEPIDPKRDPKPEPVAAPAPITTAPPNLSLIAQAQVPSVAIYDSPGAPAPTRTLENPGEYGEPLVFLIAEQAPDWLNVHLPVRPNGSTGWIRSSDVTMTSTQFRIVVQLSTRELTVWQGNDVFHREPVGVGTSRTPTPVGLHYTRFLYPSADEIDRRKYGPYALVLSGFSEVYQTFMGGKGEVGIHGTNNPGDLGKDVSNGCIRMSNEGVTKLAQTLPQGGVPVEVLP